MDDLEEPRRLARRAITCEVRGAHILTSRPVADSERESSDRDISTV